MRPSPRSHLFPPAVDTARLLKLTPASARAAWSVSCDFDGTITCTDTVQAMLDAFAGPQWLEIEAEWTSGRIGARECLERQTALLRVRPEALAEWIDARPVDPHAADLFAQCARLGLEVRIVSDGYDWVIRRIMGRLGLGALPVFANRLVHAGEDRWTLQSPYAAEGCASGTCKCAIVAKDRPRLHIGDGRSDMCVSDVCEVVFAKASLLASRQARGLPSHPFVTLGEVADALPRLIGDGVQPRRTQAEFSRDPVV